MDEWLQIALIFIGVVAGGFFGVEYGNWRVGRRIHKYELLAFALLGLDWDEWHNMPAEAQKQFFKSYFREQAVPKVQRLWKMLFPDMNIPRPSPSRVVALDGKTYFVPRCPKCGFAAAPIYDVHVGVLVEASCPTHGVYRVRTPETTKKGGIR